MHPIYLTVLIADRRRSLEQTTRDRRTGPRHERTWLGAPRRPAA